MAWSKVQQKREDQMADGSWEDANTRRIARALKMTTQERVDYHSKGMTAVEVAWWATYQEYMGKACGDMNSEAARIASKALMMYHKAKAFHLEADGLAAEFAGTPIARDGSR